MNNAAGAPSQEKYRMPAALKAFALAIFVLSIGFVAYNFSVINECRAARSQAQAKLTELKQAKLAGAVNDAELTATDESFKKLCSRCGAV